MPYGLMAPDYDRLYARNRTPRPIGPYDPGAGEAPTPAGLYAASPMAGRMNNYQAQQNYGQTGYMPNRTVGGAYGLMGGNPDNRLVGNQLLAQASGNQYAPINGTGMGLAGAWHGGAAPGMVGGRIAWTDPMNPPREGSAGLLPDSRYIGGGTMGRAGAAGLSAISPGSPQYAAMQQARAVFDARGGGLQARQNAYAARNAAPTDMRDYRLGIFQQRQQGRMEQQQAALAAQQQRMMMGLAYTNPQMAMQLAQLNQRGQLAQQQMGLQYAQLGQQGNIAGQNSQDRRYVADQGLAASQNSLWSHRYNTAIAAGNTPDDAARLAGPPPGPAGGVGGARPAVGGLMGPQQGPDTGGASYKPKKQLLDAQVVHISGLPKDKRESALRAFGVTDQGDLDFYQRQLDPTHGQPTVSGQVLSGLGNLFLPPGMKPEGTNPKKFDRPPQPKPWTMGNLFY